MNIKTTLPPSDAEQFDGPLYLGIEVRRFGATCLSEADCGGELWSRDSEAGYCLSPDDGLIALGNRQKLTAAPYAMASTRANKLLSSCRAQRANA